MHLSHARQVAGNSGGSWFVSQMAYSEGFFLNVTGDAPVETLVKDWMVKQEPNLVATKIEIYSNIAEWLGTGVVANVFGQFVEFLLVIRTPWLANLVCTVAKSTGQVTYETCRSTIDTLAGALVTGAVTQGSWGVFIERFIKTADPVMAKKPATLGARQSRWLSPALSFQACAAASGSPRLPPSCGSRASVCRPGTLAHARPRAPPLPVATLLHAPRPSPSPAFQCIPPALRAQLGRRLPTSPTPSRAAAKSRGPSRPAASPTRASARHS